MACVLRNNEGKITKVTLDNGSESKLFNELNKNLFIHNKEDAYSVFKNIL